MTWDSNLIFFVGIATGMVIQLARQQRRAEVQTAPAPGLAEPDFPAVMAMNPADPPRPSSPTPISPSSNPGSSGQSDPSSVQSVPSDELDPAPSPSAETAIAWAQEAAIALELAQFKGGFLGRSAHELRSPINGVLGLHQLILNDLCDSPEEEREFLTQAYQGTLKTLDLMDELITISKLAVTPPTAPPEPISLRELWFEVHSIVHLLAENRNLRLDLVQPEPDLWVLGQPQLLRQLLVNLVNQAILNQDEGWIHGFAQAELTAAGHPSGWVEIYVKDQRPASAWQDPINQLQSLELEGDHPTFAKQWAQTWDETDTFYPSTSLTWFLNQSLVHTLNGSIALQSAADCPRSPSGLDTLEAPEQIVVRCRLPLAQAPELPG